MEEILDTVVETPVMETPEEVVSTNEDVNTEITNN